MTNPCYVTPPKQDNDQNGDFSWLKSKLTSELSTLQPEQILRGMLYKRCKAVLMGGSESYKTWTLMDIAYCVGNGLLWWGIHTSQTPVTYLDFELLDYDFQWRMREISTAHGKGNIDVVRRIGLHGRTLTLDHCQKFTKSLFQTVPASSSPIPHTNSSAPIAMKTLPVMSPLSPPASTALPSKPAPPLSMASIIPRVIRQIKSPLIAAPVPASGHAMPTLLFA